MYSSSDLDLNVMPVWSNNITGNGVVVCIVDDGESNSDLTFYTHMYNYQILPTPDVM